ncbi:hypothetical protein Y046_3869 [Burkholderia pseudomallei MSHR2990]|nr:hypothetical protein Y046_3869 [Burkholderia pseudomallei MSHR2990]
MAVLAAALQIDPRLEVRGRREPVVARDVARRERVAQVRREPLEKRQMRVAAVARREHEPVEALGARVARQPVAQRELHLPVRRARGGFDRGVREQPVARRAGRLAGDALQIEHLVDLLDERAIDDRVVRVAKALDERAPAARRLRVDDVGERRIEDLVDERAVVRGLERARADHEARLDVREAPREIDEHLGRALPGADHRDALSRVRARRADQALDRREVARRMDDALGPERGERIRHARRAADAHRQRTRDALPLAPVGALRDHAQRVDLAGRARRRDGLDRRHRLAVMDALVERVRDPAQVIVKLDARRIEILQVHELAQAPVLVQVVDEREAALRVAQRDEILQEGNLHPAVVEQHPAVPAERRLALDVAMRERGGLARFRESHGEREVRRPETDADQVEYGISLHVSDSLNGVAGARTAPAGRKRDADRAVHRCARCGHRARPAPGAAAAGGAQSASRACVAGWPAVCAARSPSAARLGAANTSAIASAKPAERAASTKRTTSNDVAPASNRLASGAGAAWPSDARHSSASARAARAAARASAAAGGGGAYASFEASGIGAAHALSARAGESSKPRTSSR